MSLGTYPEVSLREAREKRDEARQQLRNGIDPGANRKAVKAAESGEDIKDAFEVVAREWFNKNLGTWTEAHAEKLRRRLEKDVYPWLGKRPVADITTRRNHPP